MFEHFILGIPRQPLPLTLPPLARGDARGFSHSGPLSNLSDVSPGTCLPPSGSYFPPFTVGEGGRRPSVNRLGSLDGLENALAAMERGTTIDKDTEDVGICQLERSEARDVSEMRDEMFIGSGEVEPKVEKESEAGGDIMAQRRRLRGREGRRLAILSDHVKCPSADQLFEEVRRRDEVCGLAFRTRMKEITESADVPDAKVEEPTDSTEVRAVAARAGDYIPREVTQPRRHSTFYPSPPGEPPLELQTSFEPEEQRSTSSSVNETPAHWLKTYTSLIGRAHNLERRNRLSAGVLQARVCKKICQRRGM